MKNSSILLNYISQNKYISNHVVKPIEDFTKKEEDIIFNILKYKIRVSGYESDLDKAPRCHRSSIEKDLQESKEFLKEHQNKAIKLGIWKD